MATGPGDELETAGRGHLRASHADREQVIGALKAAFMHGRLTKDEFDVRVGQTLAARTCGPGPVTADLPPAPPRSPAARACPGAGRGADSAAWAGARGSHRVVCGRVGVHVGQRLAITRTA